MNPDAVVFVDHTRLISSGMMKPPGTFGITKSVPASVVTRTFPVVPT